MSEYRKLKTKFMSRSLMRDALKAAGVEYVETKPGHEEHLYGYKGDERPETATFIVRRQSIGSFSNDLGWHWDAAQKCFTEIVSAYDASVQRCTDIRQTVKREYAVASTVAAAKAKGYRTSRIDNADGTVQVVVTGRV